jgi:FG-GAP-like repeat
MNIPVSKNLIRAAIALITTAIASTSRADNLTDTGDIDNDSFADIATVTNSTTVTVYLSNGDGTYTVSAILKAPKNKNITYVDLIDLDGDGALDVYTASPASGGWVYYYTWYGNGDGTFGAMVTNKWARKGNPHIGL